MLRALLLTVLVSISLQQKVNFVMMNKMLHHTTPENLLALVKALNAETVVANQKTKIKAFISSKWAVTQKTYSWYDNKTYAQQKACAFMDHRAALKDFVTKFMPVELAKGGYLSAPIIEKLKQLFWATDRFSHVSNPIWWDPQTDFRVFTTVVITDAKKRTAFLDKFFNISELYRKNQPAKFKQAFDFQQFDHDYSFARLAQVRA